MNPELPLRDIHLPEPVSWWPPAIGWWIVLATILLGLALYWAIRKYKRRHRLRAQALAELKQIEAAYAEHQNPQQLAGDISVLLRRVCITRFPRNEVASLNGSAWLVFLNRQANTFNDETALILIEAPYRPTCEFNPAALISACRNWLQQLQTKAVQA